MNKILVINGAVKPKEYSRATAIKDKFIEEYKSLNPSDEIINMDLGDVEIANTTLNKDTINNFFDQKNSLDYIEQLKSVNKLVVVTPMINFNISPLLKNYLDHIIVANQTLSYALSKHPEGKPVGTLDNLEVQIIITKGSPESWYVEFFDLPKYLVGLWSLLGAKVSKPLIVAGTDMPPLAAMSPNEVATKFESEIKNAAKDF